MKTQNCVIRIVAAVGAIFGIAISALAQSGTWINPNGGSWSASTNWQGGIIARGTDASADFSTLSLTGNATITLDASQTVGSIIFGDRAGAHSWILDAGTAGTLTFSGSASPVVVTVSNETATINAPVSGAQGLTQNGSGTLVFAQPLGVVDGVTNASGALELLATFNTSNNPTYYAPLVVNGVVQSSGTLNLDVDQNNDAGSTNVFGDGTLRLTGANNSSTSPDLFFAPDAVANDYYGAALAAATLDLGGSQRYIFALTEHNAVARYDPYEDARIDANIIGAGGITYIAQNTYGGGSPMECQLVLAGTNSFTGEVEIQRGSIYLFNPAALAQTNKLLLDPAAGNNARLFLYGNNAIVENLESGGEGTPLIANGNVNNPITIAPSTLTVAQTSNTVFAGALVDGQYEYDDGSNLPGALSLVKVGPGTLSLTGANTYSGLTGIQSGVLNISAAKTGGGPVSLADGTTLGIIGIDGNSVAMSDLALGVSGATSLNFTFSGALVPFLAPIITGTLEANGAVNSVTINISTNGVGIPVGQYPLIQYTSGSIGGSGAGFGAFDLGTLPSGVVATLVNDMTNNSIDLKVTSGTAAPSQSGVWIDAKGGSWANPTNWQGGAIAQGIGTTADFSTLTLPGNATVTLDEALSIGNLIFADHGNAHNWTLNAGLGGPLSLRADASPTITVSNQTATIGLTLVGTQGLTKNGSGTLVLAQPPGYGGSTTNNGGLLEFLTSVNSSNNPSFNDPLVINGGVVESSATFNLDVAQNNDAGSTNVLGDGTLRLIRNDAVGLVPPFVD